MKSSLCKTLPKPSDIDSLSHSHSILSTTITVGLQPNFSIISATTSILPDPLHIYTWNLGLKTLLYYPQNPITTHSDSLQLVLTRFSSVFFLLLHFHVVFSYPTIVLPTFACLSSFACRVDVLPFHPLYLLSLFSLYSLPSMILLRTSILNVPLLHPPLLPSLLSSIVVHLLHTWDFPQNCI
jgi:hypothetical protein